MVAISFGTLSGTLSAPSSATTSTAGTVAPAEAGTEESPVAQPTVADGAASGGSAAPEETATRETLAATRFPQPPGQIRKALNGLARTVKNELKELARSGELSESEALELRSVAREFKKSVGDAFREEIARDGGNRSYDAEAFVGRIESSLQAARDRVASIFAPPAPPEPVGEPAVPTAPDGGALPVAGDPLAPVEEPATVAPSDPVEPVVVDPAPDEADPLARLAELFESVLAEVRNLISELSFVEPDPVSVGEGVEGGSDLAADAYERSGTQTVATSEVDSEA